MMRQQHAGRHQKLRLTRAFLDSFILSEISCEGKRSRVGGSYVPETIREDESCCSAAEICTEYTYTSCYHFSFISIQGRKFVLFLGT